MNIRFFWYYMVSYRGKTIFLPGKALTYYNSDKQDTITLKVQLCLVYLGGNQFLSSLSYALLNNGEIIPTTENPASYQRLIRSLIVKEI